METANSILNKYKPGVTKRVLLIVTGLVWTFAGGMLLIKGFQMLSDQPHNFWIKLIFSFMGGVLFFVLLFKKLSLKTHKTHPVFGGWKTLCILVFQLESLLNDDTDDNNRNYFTNNRVVSPDILSVLYIMMGIPLLSFALRFYINGFINHSTNKNNTFMQFPLNFTFKITTISNDFRVNDATGAEVAFVRQKLFKLKEEVQVFNDESRSQLNFTS